MERRRREEGEEEEEQKEKKVSVTRVNETTSWKHWRGVTF